MDTRIAEPADASHRADRLVEGATSQRRLQVLAALSRDLAHPLDARALFRALHTSLAEMLDVPIVMLGLYHAPTQTVEVVGQVDSGVELREGPWSFPLGSGFTSDVIRTRQPRLVRRWSTDGPPISLFYSDDSSKLVSPQSGMCVPLAFGDEVVGVLSVQSYQPAAYDEQDLLLLEVVAGQAAAAIDRLRHSAQQDAQLRRRVLELEAILASMADGLLIVDAAGRVLRLNHAAREILCLDGNSLVVGQPLDRKPWDAWWPGARAVADALASLVDAVLRGEARREVEVELRGSERRVLSMSCAPLADRVHGPQGGVIVLRDVTGRREAERLKDEVLAIASHDLRTPVAVLKMQAQLLRRQASSGKADSAYLCDRLALMEGQAVRLGKLLDLLLDLSRLEAGRLALSIAPMDLCALVRAQVEGVQALSQRHTLVVHAPDHLPGTWDEQRLGQVLQNLLTNAAKYSPDGGTITVDVVETADSVAVTVCDQGIGIPAEDLPHLFERFYRVEGARSLEGTGLGLYICRGVLAAHGGRIWASSAGPGQGSCFGFSLPRRAVETAGATGAA